MRIRKKNLTVGYINLTTKTLISSIEINKNFLSLLGQYVHVKVIPTGTYKGIKIFFKRIAQYHFDYLYVDCYSYLMESFLLREKLGIDIPLIIKLHTVYPWIYRYVNIIPLIRKYDIIYSPCQYAKDSFLKISSEFDVPIINNCLDIQSIKECISSKCDSSGKEITFMGRLTETKGIGTLIDCMPEVISQVGNVHLNIIGPLSGSGKNNYPIDSYVRSLQRKVNRLGISDSVSFTGALFGGDKYSKLSRSDVFVNLTTTIEDASPNVNLEAMVSGVPVIATDWAGNKELIVNGKNGYLLDVKFNRKGVPEIENKKLISLIVRILKNRSLNCRLKANAVKTADSYDFQKVIPQMVRLLKKTHKPYQSNWGKIKNKRVLDFPHLFNSNFLSFLYFQPRFRMDNYEHLYRRYVELIPENHKTYLEGQQPKSKPSAKGKRIYGLLQREGLNLFLPGGSHY